MQKERLSASPTLPAYQCNLHSRPAEEEGFEPPDPCGSADFESAALDLAMRLLHSNFMAPEQRPADDNDGPARLRWSAFDTLGLSAISIAFLALALIYSAATPPLEAGDENLHFFVIRHIVESGGLAVLDTTDDARPDDPHQEAGQPPLYHWLASVAIRGLSSDDVLSYAPNPHAFIGIPTTDPANRNRVVHPPNEESLSSVQALRRARLVSIAFGLVAVLATYMLARAVVPGHPAIALLSAALVAFNPMFLFISASVSNDSAIAALSAISLLLILRTLDARLSLRSGALQGGFIGLACLAKLSGLGLLPLAIGAALYAGRRHAAWRPVLHHVVGIVGAFAVVAGWWFVRNLMLYGDPTAVSAWISVVGTRTRPVDLEEVRGLWVAFWGVFGAFDILAQPWVYSVYAVVCLAAIAGWLGTFLAGGRYPFRAVGIVLLTFWLVIEATALARWTSMNYASSGRLLFPAISAVAILISVGLLLSLTSARRLQAAAAAAGVLGAIAAVIPSLSLTPAYRPVPIVNETALAASATFTRTTFGGVVALEGAQVAPRTESGKPVEVELFWRSLQRTDRNYSLSVQLLGRDGGRVGQIDVFPGAGRYPTSLWQPGDLVKDALKVPVSSPIDSTTGARVAVALYEFENHNNLEARNPDGASVYPVVVGTTEIIGGPPARCDEGVPDGLFGGQVRLVSVSPRPEFVAPGNAITVSLAWCVAKRPVPDYTAFVHLAQPGRPPVAQHDGPPRAAYPTSAWAGGEIVTDLRSFSVPPNAPNGRYRLLVGLYDPRDGSRLKTESGREFVDLGPLAVGTPRSIFAS